MIARPVVEEASPSNAAIWSSSTEMTEWVKRVLLPKISSLDPKRTATQAAEQYRKLVLERSKKDVPNRQLLADEQVGFEPTLPETGHGTVLSISDSLRSRSSLYLSLRTCCTRR